LDIGHQPKIGDLVIVEWRDSFVDNGQTAYTALGDDCRWVNVGWVVRKSDLFITISSGVQLTKDSNGEFDNPLSIPWQMLIGEPQVLA
jgi:hypothetical protein